MKDHVGVKPNASQHADDPASAAPPKIRWQPITRPIAGAEGLGEAGSSDASTAPATEGVYVVTLSDLQYANLQGVATVVPARTFAEIRRLEECTQHIRMELIYDDGDDSLVAAQSIHSPWNVGGSHEVRLVQSKIDRMRFPRLP